MKNIYQMTIVLVSVLALTHCGLAKDASDTLHQTEEMNRKMDQTNQKMDQTNQKMDLTNNQIAATNKKMDHTNEGIDKTNEAVHTQTLAVALNSLLGSENTEVLTPPTDMIAFAEKFVEEATPREIIQTFHLLYTSVIKGFEHEANGDKKLHRRRVRLTAASALAALASTDKANEILEAQIVQEGEYLDTAHVFAFCRYTFTRDFLLKPVLDPKRTPTLKLLEVAQKHYAVLKQLANVSYADKLKLTIPEFVIKNVETGEVAALEDVLNPAEHKGLGRAAVRKFDDKNNPKMQTPEAQTLINLLK